MFNFNFLIKGAKLNKLLSLSTRPDPMLLEHFKSFTYCPSSCMEGSPMCTENPLSPVRFRAAVSTT